MAKEQLIVCLSDNENFYLEKDKVLADSWPFDCGGCISDSCVDCILKTKPMTRTEAIERMAKGLAKYNNPVKQAEAALDTLITEVK